MRVLLVTGGSSSERKISFMSAKNVREGLEEAGYLVKVFDFKKGKVQLKKLIKKIDIVFPVIHGEEGEGGSLQQFLSKIKIPFVGGDPKGFKNGWYKISFKEYCDKNKILTPNWRTIKRSQDVLKFGFPSVLKSSSGGSSKEVAILKSKQDLEINFSKKLLKSGLPLFVEKYLGGIEVTAGILGNKALPIVEIVPPKGGWFDYKNKYWGKTKEIPNAPSVSSKIQKLIQKIALKIHKHFNLGPYSRIDFIVSGGKPYVLEINTIPGLTSESLLPKAAEAVGISFSNLLDKIIKLSIHS